MVVNPDGAESLRKRRALSPIKSIHEAVEDGNAQIYTSQRATDGKDPCVVWSRSFSMQIVLFDRKWASGFKRAVYK